MEIYFLTILEDGKSKIKVLADVVHGESPLPGWQIAASLLHPHRGREKTLVSLPLLTGTPVLSA